MAKYDFLTLDDVPAYVATIIQTGTPLHFPGDNIRKSRLVAVRAATGLAILEQHTWVEDTVWSVVTAYSGNRKDGPRIGTVF
ncbi:MAG: hypothetical protein P1V21_01340 [Rhizobiaceae bacterium]|nr:hypothetical protein [Rhizobiaceae bacterium]